MWKEYEENDGKWRAAMQTEQHKNIAIPTKVWLVIRHFFNPVPHTKNHSHPQQVSEPRKLVYFAKHLRQQENDSRKSNKLWEHDNIELFL